MIPQETVNLILDTAQIADVVSDYVTLKRRGANYVACCPFHNEKTPSFYVSPAKGIYKCFGCAKSGTAVGFVMEQEHCSYVEALRYLARKYHIEIVEEQEDEEELAKRQRNESLLLVSEFAQKFFRSCMQTREGVDLALQYYHSRGIEDDTIERFGLGWAPSGKDQLVQAALNAGYKMEYLLAAGVAVQREDGSIADKFIQRAMFPIHSLSGRVIAFSGRTLRSDIPAKYLNSPETEIYIKSRNLLGIYAAKAEISRLDKCILVEGNMDMVMMHQLGIRNVVASCGTSLTVDQIRLIHKFTENITIMYDGDAAGIHAALRGISMILTEGMNVKIVLLPDGEDPDSFARQHSLSEVQDFIAAEEKDFIAFKTELLLKEASNDPLRKANLINDIADTIACIADAVKRSVYVEYTADRFAIETSILFDRISATRRRISEDLRREQQREQRQAGQFSRAAQFPQQSSPSQEVSYANSSSSAAMVGAATTASTGVVYEENKLLADAERDLLYFMLTHGCDILDFPSDSDFYSGSEEDKCTVVDFIRDALESDNTEFANTIYASVYKQYMQLYDEGKNQSEIVIDLLNQPDRSVANAVAELSTEKYSLSVDAFKKAMTTTSSWLVAQVPKAIMLYAERRIQNSLVILQHNLLEAPDNEQDEILLKMMKLQSAQRRIKQKIGREKIIKKYE